MHAEILVTGTELLLGEIVDTNSAMMARMLRDIGLDLYYKSTVGDNRERMAGVLKTALERSDIVLVSGGLGPTVDDVTREAVSDVTGRPLIFHQELLDQIAARFARFGRPMSENNRRQAYLPEGAIAVENPVGTAPAFIVEDRRGTIICLPGVPRELEYLMTQRIIPYLKQRLGAATVITVKVLRTCTIGESQIDARIADLMTMSNPTVGLSAHPGQVDVRITAKAASQAEAERLIAPVEAELRARLGDVIYGEGTETLEEVVARLLAERDIRLAVVDNATAGEIAERLRQTAHAQVLDTLEPAVGYLGGETATPAASAATLDAHASPAGPQAIAAELAARARAETGAGLGLAVFALTRPGPDERPLTFLALDAGRQAVLRWVQFAGDNHLTRRWLSTRALDLVRRYLIGALDEEAA